MRGKVARAIRRHCGYKPGNTTYKEIVAAEETMLKLDIEATKAAGEPRLKVVKVPKVTIFHNDEIRALYQATKKVFYKMKKGL